MTDEKKPASIALADAPSLGMKWLVLGMAPGVEFYAALDTRREANQYIAEASGHVRHDYFVVVKARDFYSI